jgi:hypothetical protein
LNGYVSANPQLALYLSSVVMRIPSYNGDFEEPWYWGVHGRDLYLYSYYMDMYNVTGNVTCLDEALAAEARVPASIVSEFLWRRQRNYNVSQARHNKNWSFASDFYIISGEGGIYTCISQISKINSKQ